jgi:hypothetical protein
MRLSVTLVGFIATRALGYTSWPPTSCPPFTKGTFSVNQLQLYPENADWDTKTCLVYFGLDIIPIKLEQLIFPYDSHEEANLPSISALFNASVAVLDPYTDKIVDIWTFPGVTHNPDQHIGGVAADPYTGLITVLTDAAAAFGTSGTDVSGNNLLYKVEPITKTIIWTANLTALTNGKYGGFQDVEHDVYGNTYVVGTYPSSIVRVNALGVASPWYGPNGVPTTTYGYAGLAAVFGTNILLVNDNASGELYRFNMSEPMGHPVLVPRTPANISLGDSDAIYLPPRYGGKVLLVANDLGGTTVLRSKDGLWNTAEQLGTISDNVTEAQGGFVPSTIEISGSLFSVQEFFFDGDSSTIPESGNRTVFPLVDITAKVEALLAQ